MMKHNMQCKRCAGTINVGTYRKYTVCPYCKNKTVFAGFQYQNIDWNSSMYAKVKLWMDCPSCRSPNMYLGPSGKKWRCPDCGYTISRFQKNTTVFWFCDDCDAFLNVQEGFTTKNGRWICSECGFSNEVTKENVL